jgi:hypothetical protein
MQGEPYQISDFVIEQEQPKKPIKLFDESLYFLWEVVEASMSPRCQLIEVILCNNSMSSRY